MAKLIIDIGNSRTTFGLFESDGKLHTFHIQSNRHAYADELFTYLETNLSRRKHSLEKQLEKAVLASVVPALESTWSQLFHELSIPLVIAKESSPWSFEIQLPNPAILGADRMANAQGALRFGAPAIVVDAGTATTFDIIGKNENCFAYMGGIISPGVGISMNALVQKTALLGPIALTPSSGELPVVGHDTKTAMSSGAIHGFAFMVDGMVEAIRKEKNFPQDCPVIATGGFGYLLEGTSQSVTHFEPNLTLEGLYAIA